MAVAYTALDYLGPVIIVLIGIAMGILLSILLGYKLAMRLKWVWFGYVLVLSVSIVCICSGLSYIGPHLEEIEAIVPNQSQTRITAGVIEQVVPVGGRRIYWIKGKRCGAVYVSIGKEQYYVISEGFLTEEMLVEVQYAEQENKRKVILSWKETTEEQAAVLKEQMNVEEETTSTVPLREISQNMRSLSNMLVIVGIWGFLGTIALAHVGRFKIANYLLKKDAAIYDAIIPNRMAILITAIPVLLFAMITVGLSMMYGEYSVLVVLAMGACVMGGVTLCKQMTSLHIDGQFLTVRSLGKERRYRISDIHMMKWKSCRGMTGKRLMILFCDGKFYEFEMDHYRGVQNTYNALTRQIADDEKEKNV